jgi:membrane dipeptidase
VSIEGVGRVVDGHLDVAWNVLYNGRDLRLPVRVIRDVETSQHRSTAVTSLATMADAGVAVVFATVFVVPAKRWSNTLVRYPSVRPMAIYHTPAEAESQALEQLRIYEDWAEQGVIRIIRSRVTLEDHLVRWARDRRPGFVLGMEGADAILDPSLVRTWWSRGIRLVGLAWSTTRYAGGTGSHKGLTEPGRELLQAMAEVGVIHDVTHLSEEAFWDAAAEPHHAMCATHSSARALMEKDECVASATPANRYLSGTQIVEVGKPRGATTAGMIGVPLLNQFLQSKWGRAGYPDVSITSDVAGHFEHIAELVGWKSVGIGSDVDAGYGRDDIPLEIDTMEDWRRIGDVVPPAERARVLGENWLRFLYETLPAA